MLVSEIMLQQTRVEAVIPYYAAFLAKFPTAADLARAPEQDVLTAWAGLGYYSRARNLRLAAIGMTEQPPDTYTALLRLTGVGPYTAAALASICLGEPYAAVDGNVLRVVSRLCNDPSEISSTIAKRRFTEEAQVLLDPRRPGDFNQAMMELGATICVPGNPACLLCPVRAFCAAEKAGTQRELPVKAGKGAARRVGMDLLLCEVDSHVFLVKRASSERRMAGFWELPAAPERYLTAAPAAEFTHQIVNDRFRVRVWAASPARRPSGLKDGVWVSRPQLDGLPVSTITKKAMKRLERHRTDD